MNYFNQMYGAMPQQQRNPQFNQQVFAQKIKQVNDQFLNQVVEQARAQGISEQDIQNGINLINNLRR